MKKSFTVIIALLLVNTAFSQPKWQFSLTAGYSMPVSDFRGKFDDTLASTGVINFSNQLTYLVTKGFNINAAARYTVDTTGNAIVTGGMGFNSFSQSVDYMRPSGLTRSFYNNISIFSFMAGAEYDISPKNKFNPFIGLEFAVNLFSGKVTGSGDTTFNLNRSSESRFGINANAGLNVKIKKNFSIIFGVKYCFDNLFGKKHDQPTVTSGNTDSQPNTGGSVTADLPLNDGEFGTIQARQIIHLQFYAGASFSFGKVK